MTKNELYNNILKKDSFLCVGLDTDITKIPKKFLSVGDPIFEFNKYIIESTNKYCVAYKINAAFYECLGSSGWVSMEKTIGYINDNYPDVFTIADAKRGDIGNTSLMYAKSFYDNMNFDSVTVSPYMGSDSTSKYKLLYN
jgi:orotidine-5'-phosphate decarboxylase